MSDPRLELDFPSIAAFGRDLERVATLRAAPRPARTRLIAVAAALAFAVAVGAANLMIGDDPHPVVGTPAPTTTTTDPDEIVGRDYNCGQPDGVPGDVIVIRNLTCSEATAVAQAYWRSGRFPTIGDLTGEPR